jgi:hypothetical protein
VGFETRSPDEIDVYALWHEKAMRDIRVCLPCQVTAYDKDAGTVSVKPQVMETFADENDVEQLAALAVIANVPVRWPGGGGMRLTFPLAAGDTGHIVIADRSIDAWLGQASPADTAPGDGRRHAFQDAIFEPGLRVAGQAWTNVSASIAQIGKDGGTADAVARASQVDAFITGFGSFLTDFSTFVTALAAPGPLLIITEVSTAAGALETALATLLPGPPIWPGPFTVGSDSLETLE